MSTQHVQAVIRSPPRLVESMLHTLIEQRETLLPFAGGMLIRDESGDPLYSKLAEAINAIKDVMEGFRALAYPEDAKVISYDITEMAHAGMLAGRCLAELARRGWL